MCTLNLFNTAVKPVTQKIIVHDALEI